MAHVTSWKMTEAPGILRHDERQQKHYERQQKHYERQPENSKFGRKNECINPDLTAKNYQLSPHRQQPFKTWLQNTCAEAGVRLSNRKDLNVMSSWVISLPTDVKPEDEHLFFCGCYKFLADRYGGSQFMASSTVHMDETTPHLHHCFIPVATDKNGVKTVSSKLCLTRTELLNFHKDLSNYIEKEVLGYPVSIENGKTQDGNLTVDELKRNTTLKNAKKQCLELEDLEMNINLLKKDLNAYKHENEPKNDIAKKSVFKKIILSENEYNQLVQENEDLKLQNKSLKIRIENYKESLKTHYPSIVNSDLQEILQEKNEEINRLVEKNRQLHIDFGASTKNAQDIIRWMSSDKSLTEEYQNWRKKERAFEISTKKKIERESQR